MESRFGRDFRSVRVHTDPRAAVSAETIDARAYTVGRDIVFGRNQYAPKSHSGRRLLAHELAHVVQQRGVRSPIGPDVRNSLHVAAEDSPYEREAETVGGFGDHGRVRTETTLPHATAVHRQVRGDSDRGTATDWRRSGEPLPYREATELYECIRLMGDENTAYCRQEVLGEPIDPSAPTPVPSVFRIVLQNVSVTGHPSVVERVIRSAFGPLADRAGRRLEFGRSGGGDLDLVFDPGGRPDRPCALSILGNEDGSIFVGAMAELRVCSGPQGGPRNPNYTSQLAHVFDPDEPLFGRALGNTSVHELGHMIASLEHTADTFNYMYAVGSIGANLPRSHRTLQTMRSHWAGSKEFTAGQKNRLVAAIATNRFTGGVRIDTGTTPSPQHTGRMRTPSGSGRRQSSGETGGGPTLSPRQPRLPPISPPPSPTRAEPPTDCPTTDVARREIRVSDLRDEVERTIRGSIARERSRARVQPSHQFTPRLARRVDQAIRAEFGQLLPTAPGFTDPQSVTARTPQELGRIRIRDQADALRRIGEVARETSAAVAARRAERVSSESSRAVSPEPFDTLRRLCITDPTNRLVREEIAIPLLRRLDLRTIREFELSRIGGQTSFSPASGGGLQRRVDVPTEHRYLGHILVHEAVHFYVHEDYFRTADGHPLEDELLEGGAEFLTRHVIHSRLDNDPAFRPNYSVFSEEFQYVRDHLLRGGLSVFALAYFQGHVDLLGLVPDTGTSRVSPASGAPQVQRQPTGDVGDELGEEFRRERRRELGRIIEGLRFRKIIRDCPENQGPSLAESLRRLQQRVNRNDACVQFFVDRFGFHPNRLFSPRRLPTWMVDPELRHSAQIRCPTPSIRIGLGLCRSPLRERVMLHELVHYAGCLTARRRPTPEELVERGVLVCLGTVLEEQEYQRQRRGLSGSRSERPTR